MRDDLQIHIQRIKEGDESAFQAFYESTKDDVYRMVSFLANRQNDVCDIVNEIYFETVRSLHNYKMEQSFKHWFHGIIVRQTANWNRKLWRLLRTSEKHKQFVVAEAAETPERKVIMQESRLELIGMLTRLSYKLRSVVVLRYYHDNSLAEIAEILQIPLGTVKSRHDQALKKLREFSGASKQGKETTQHVY